MKFEIKSIIEKQKGLGLPIDFLNVSKYDGDEKINVRELNPQSAVITFTVEPIFRANEDGSNASITKFNLELVSLKVIAEVIGSDDEGLFHDPDHELCLKEFTHKLYFDDYSPSRGDELEVKMVEIDFKDKVIFLIA
jgi:hypothetical protein